MPGMSVTTVRNLNDEHTGSEAAKSQIPNAKAFGILLYKENHRQYRRYQKAFAMPSPPVNGRLGKGEKVG